ncbi:tetratricopeptide (TPR) repeat protein [Desulfobaculum xiamenense]|uniref:Tetratricopeptide (TPR) repeat protein n=1 Tax=Desulfobaculum xiamenense TaxID=995050 RepID=A0A846QLL4_9BACT|nr:hypothetical protein [Desulfobaculum xiamenense]NJB67083.1 tetratricopeptide (TPR) repeat protein [Desulfobaculum xiamenense]
MSEPRKLWFVGDSSASGIGLGREVFPRRLVGLLRDAGRGPVEAVNCAVPGFTSTDAAALIHDLSGAGEIGPGAAVVFYLGNNELAASAYKGRYGGLRRWGRALRSLVPNSGGLRRPAGMCELHFEDVPQTPSVANTLDDFRCNMDRALREVRRTGARAVVVVPVANPDFPHGVGLANAAWFKTVGVRDRISEFLGRWYEPQGEHQAWLFGGVVAMEKGRWALAREHFAQAAHSEQACVRSAALNNLGTALAGLGQLSDARFELERGLAEHPEYAPLYLANIARVCRMTNRDGEACELNAQAYESDASLYRVRESVRRAALDVAVRNGAGIVDVAEYADAASFVDYCHPTPELHERLAGAVLAELHGFAPEGGLCAYRTWFVSPDAYSGRCGTLLDYYLIDRDEADPGQCFAEFMETAAVDVPGGDMLAEAFTGFTRSALAHPLFGHGADLLTVAPEYWFEVLSFPEFHTYRVMSAYMDALEQAGEGGILGQYGNFDFSSAAYASLVLMKRPRALPREVDMSLPYAARLVDNVRNALRELGRAAVDPEVRRRTVIYWYTRESFRYGTHSRPSMLIDAWGYERAMEALLAALAIWRTADAGALFDAGRVALDGLAAHVEGLSHDLWMGGGVGDANVRNMAFLAGFDLELQALSHLANGGAR